VGFIVLDTDVASLSYKGRLSDAVTSRLVGHTLCVTFVTVAEMARWAEKRNWGTKARTQLVHCLGNKVVLPYDINMSWCWGHLIATSEARGRSRPTDDTWIAACCLVAGLPLATLNVKDFADLINHEGLRLITN
jgi:toxin FitB